MEAIADQERRWVREAKSGDYEAFEKLVSRHERRLYGLVMQIVRHSRDAEDVVQTAFLNALENLDRFREDSSFSTWITRIATNAALKVLRRRRRSEALVGFSGDDGSAGTDDGYDRVPHPECLHPWCLDPHERIESAELKRILEEAVEDLPPNYRVVFVLRDIQGLSTLETAEALELSESNVKVRLLRARLALREKLSQVLADPEAPLAGPTHSNWRSS